ncbi:hypothetical protein RRG08_049140 [Elysia crispata]|uniref:Uncharacterized protein n=1 Tax=Elysia crispata TaxID=231223 RepID=A0AAE0YLF1_9GAST|nr:hypothetical protein RRG08_049140 [Elysia crispata]
MASITKHFASSNLCGRREIQVPARNLPRVPVLNQDFRITEKGHAHSVHADQKDRVLIDLHCLAHQKSQVAMHVRT